MMTHNFTIGAHFSYTLVVNSLLSLNVVSYDKLFCGQLATRV